MKADNPIYLNRIKVCEALRSGRYGQGRGSGSFHHAHPSFACFMGVARLELGMPASYEQVRDAIGLNFQQMVDGVMNNDLRGDTHEQMADWLERQA